MRFLSSVATLAAFSVIFAGADRTDAMAQDISVLGSPTGAGAPFAITRCSVLNRVGSFTEADVTVLNRTKHQLLAADIVLRFFDADSALIGETHIDLPLNGPVISNDTTLSSVSIVAQVSLSEPSSAVKRIDCRPTAATFTGNRKWAFGSRWPEKLLPMPKKPKAAADIVPSQEAASLWIVPKSTLAFARKAASVFTPPSDADQDVALR